METKVLTQEELQQLKSIQEKRAKFVEQFGILEMRVQEINIKKELLNKKKVKKYYGNDFRTIKRRIKTIS